MAGNPICDGTASKQEYRHQVQVCSSIRVEIYLLKSYFVLEVIRRLPKLPSLDGDIIKESEREEALGASSG